MLDLSVHMTPSEMLATSILFRIRANAKPRWSSCQVSRWRRHRLRRQWYKQHRMLTVQPQEVRATVLGPIIRSRFYRCCSDMPVNGRVCFVGRALRSESSIACAGIPFNDTVTGCSSGNGFNSFEAVYWQLKESRQGRPFLLDTTYGSDTDGGARCHVSLTCSQLCICRRGTLKWHSIYPYTAAGITGGSILPVSCW